MNLINYVNEYFGSHNVTQIQDDPNVLRCINNHTNNVPYQLIYVDQSNGWKRADFASYIESLIIKDHGLSARGQNGKEAAVLAPGLTL